MNTRATRAGNKNPQMFRRGGAYDPRVQADQVQFARQDAIPLENMIPLSDAVDDANNSIANNARIQVNYSIFTLNGIIPATGALLIPRNANRSSFIVSNPQSTSQDVFWSYGQLSGSNGQIFGFFLGPNGFWPENAGVVGINDIYIYPFDATLPVQVVGYEGVPVLNVSR